MSRSFDAVLFDFGGVFTQSPFDIMEPVGRELGISGSQLQELMFGPYDSDTDHPWHRLERGEIDVKEARRALIEQAESEGIDAFDPFGVLMKLRMDGGTSEVMVECVRRLREERYATAMVTNNVREFRSAWRATIPVDELFDVVIDSSEVGVRKPDPAIFELTLERLGGLAPERTVFLDDYEGNLVTSRSLGIVSLRVADPVVAVKELDEILRDAP